LSGGETNLSGKLIGTTSKEYDTHQGNTISSGKDEGRRKDEKTKWRKEKEKIKERRWEEKNKGFDAGRSATWLR